MKLYKREGRRFVETTNPTDCIGMYVDNSGLFFTKDKMQSSIGKCVMIEDGHYIIACTEDHVRVTFTETLRYKWEMCTYYDAFIPSIELLFYTAHKYPELFNKQKQYMSSSSFYVQLSGYSYVLSLFFVSDYQCWVIYSAVISNRLSIKPFFKIPIL